MNRLLAVLGALLPVLGCDFLSAKDDGFYLRFERIEGTSGFPSARPLVFGGRVHWTGDAGTTESTDAGDVQHGELRWATAFNDKIVGLAGSGAAGVVTTTDWQSLQTVSNESFDLLASSGTGLVALRRVGLGRFASFFSDDDGATWRPGDELTAGFDIGDGDGATLQNGAFGRVRATITIFAQNAGSNFDFASQTYELQGNKATVVGRSGNPEIERKAPPFPDLVTGGLAFLPDPEGMVPFQGDSTSLVVVRGDGADGELSAGQRLRWAIVGRDASTTNGEVGAVGVDDEGRLLLASAGALFRSVNPLGDDDERASILAGPGCDGRTSWEPPSYDEDSVKTTVRNASGARLTAYQIDTEKRWQWIGLVEDGDELDLNIAYPRAATPFARVMFTNDDDTCVAVVVVPDAETAEFTIEPL
jgi:hypothetical protein